MCEGVGLGLGFKRDLVRAQYMGLIESHLIHDMLVSIPGWHLLEGSVYCCMTIAYALRWGVALIVFHSTGNCSPRRGTPFQV